MDRFFVFVFLLSCFCIEAQVGINTTNPDPSSSLDINSTESGILIPRMTTAERNDNIPNPANGLLIYNTDKEAFQYFSNGTWFEINKVQNCGFISIPSQVRESMDIGASETVTVNLQNTLGTPGNITTSLVFSSPGFDISNILITNNDTTAPTSQDITFTLDSSSTAAVGSSGQIIFQLLADCGEIQNLIIDLTITGCEFDVLANSETIFTTIPITGTKVLTYDFNITQTGTSSGVVNISSNDLPNINELNSGSCSYTCALDFSLEIDNTISAGTYTYNLDFISSCGTTVTKSIDLVIEENPRDCKQILFDNPSATSGVYQIDPDGFGGITPFDCYCDMTTDNGGWMLVMNYNHLENTNPGKQTRSSSLPLLGSTNLGNDESNTVFWGHASNTLLDNFEFTEVRFYGKTSNHSRILHFKIAQSQMVSYFKTGIGGVNISDLKNNFIPLNGEHTADLPFSATSRATNRNDDAMTIRPFYRNSNTRDWRVGGSGSNDWEMDDNPNDQSNSTIHQVWVR